MERDLPVNDPIHLLAINVFANKGAYALVIGSGVSTSAGILTGRAIVHDVIRQLASLEGEVCGHDREDDWYAEKMGGERPTYDAVIGRITSTPAERAHLLKGYIEATNEHVAAGERVPQEAHRAIARLVRKGFVRVIVTTNFDHLLEDALRGENVEPRIITTPDAVEHALPLVHQDCTIVKVHGDYTSGKLLNTTNELDHYEEPLRTLLARIFRDFGLIVSGWSSDSDAALAALITENASGAFSLFWTGVDAPSEGALAVMEQRPSKEFILIDGADSLFQTLEEKVTAIQDLRNSETLTPEIAAATIKRHLAGPLLNPIRADDLIGQELRNALPWLRDHMVVGTSSAPYFLNALPELRRETQNLLVMAAVTARWGTPENHPTLANTLATVLNDSRNYGHEVRWSGFWGYLGMELFYCAGAAALLGGHCETVVMLLQDPVIEISGPLPPVLSAIKEAYEGITSMLAFEAPRGSPVLFSRRMESEAQSLTTYLNVDSAAMAAAFDRFDYLLSLVYVDHTGQQLGNMTWAPLGLFAYRPLLSREQGVIFKTDREADDQMDAWPPLRSGLFGSDRARYLAAREAIASIIKDRNTR